MGGKSGGTTNNYERELSAEELQLLETQNQQLQKGIAVAESQEARSNEQHQIWKDNYLPMEVQLGGKADPAAEKKYNDMLDNQMPRYAEDTSGVMNQPQRQPSQAQIGGGKGGASKGRAA